MFSRAGIVVSASTAVLLVAAAPSGAAALNPHAGPVADVSAACALGSNAEVQTAVDPVAKIAYDEWIGCADRSGSGLGFARSVDGGATWTRAVKLPGSTFGWDPAIAVGRHGIVYAAFMMSRGGRSFPVVDISSDHGQKFRVRQLPVPAGTNFGDRDYIAVGPTGEIYVTWDYSPNPKITVRCYPAGSCSFVSGAFNVVMERSGNGGKTWSKIIPISPGFPASGGISAPVLVEPDGRIDVLYERYKVLSKKTMKLGPGHNYFSSSADGGQRWSRPVRLGPAARTLATSTWWIDGSLGMDAGRNLYATWDTQGRRGDDTGWLSYSVNRGRTWSVPRQVTPGTGPATNIVQVVGAARDVAYVGWLTDRPVLGYAQFVRPFAIGKGWLSPAIAVSASYGSRNVWPGDTIGMAMLPGGAPGTRRLLVSWGSAVGGNPAPSAIWAALVTALP